MAKEFEKYGRHAVLETWQCFQLVCGLNLAAINSCLKQSVSLVAVHSSARSEDGNKSNKKADTSAVTIPSDRKIPEDGGGCLAFRFAVSSSDCKSAGKRMLTIQPVPLESLRLREGHQSVRDARQRHRAGQLRRTSERHHCEHSRRRRVRPESADREAD